MATGNISRFPVWGVAVSGTEDAANVAGRDLHYARTDEYIREVVEEYPPLTPEQQNRLALLLATPDE